MSDIGRVVLVMWVENRENLSVISCWLWEGIVLM